MLPLDKKARLVEVKFVKCGPRACVVNFFVSLLSLTVEFVILGHNILWVLGVF